MVLMFYKHGIGMFYKHGIDVFYKHGIGMFYKHGIGMFYKHGIGMFYKHGIDVSRRSTWWTRFSDDWRETRCGMGYPVWGMVHIT